MTASQQIWALTWAFPKLSAEDIVTISAFCGGLTSENDQLVHFLSQSFHMRNVEVRQKIASVLEDIEALKCTGGSVLTPDCADYPDSLKMACDRPPLLSVRGSLDCLQRRGFAVVGSRKITLESQLWMDQQLSQVFCQRKQSHELTVISGGAIGVDQHAHRLAVRCNVTSIVVLPVGLSRIYPVGFLGLAQALVDRGGLLVSPFRPSQGVRRSLFASRNFVLVNLSRLLFVVQAERRSGSLMSAHLAAKSGLDVAALCGAPTDQMSAGCMDLISEGATMIRSAEDLNLALSEAYS
ncbi:MAG: DNA-processing protein DprA, partial [Pseudomonadota bacterium]